MANTFGELMLRVGIDASGMDSGLNDSIKALESFEGSATRAGKALDRAFNAVGVKDSSAAVAAEMKKVQDSFEFLERSFEKGKISAEDFAKAQDGVKAKLAELSGVAAPVAKTFDEFAVSLGKTGAALQSAGSTLSVALTAPLAGIGLAAGKMAEDFDLSMHKVASLLGDDAAKSFDGLSEGVLKLSKTLGVDAVGAANALYEAISAGIPKENALEFLEVASKAAIAGVTSTKVAVDGMTNVINAYKLDISEAGKVADAMFQGVNIGKMTFEQLSASIGKAAGTAADLKVSYQELIAAAASITKVGFSASEAFTMEESAMKALITPHTQMIELIKKTGFESGVALVNAKGLEGAINAIRDAAGGSVEKLAAAYGRIEGLKASLALTGANAKGAAQDLDEVANKAGAMGKAFDEVNKSFSRQMDTFTTQLKDVGIAFGTALLPIGQDLLKSFTPLIDVLGQAAEWFAKLPMPVKETAVALAALVAAAGPALYIFGSIATSVAALAPAFVVAGEAFAGLGAAMAGAFGATAATGIGEAAVEMGALSSAAAVLVPALVGIGAAFGVFDQLKSIATTIGEIGAEFGLTKDMIVSFGEGFLGMAKNVAEFFPTVQLLESAFSGIKETIGGYITSLTTAGKFTEDFGKAAGGTQKQFSDMEIGWSDLKTSLSDMSWWTILSGGFFSFSELLKDAKSAIQDLKGTMPEMDAAVKTTVANLQAQVHAHDAISKAALQHVLAQSNVNKVTIDANAAMMAVGKSTQTYTEKLKEAKGELANIKTAFLAGTATKADVAAQEQIIKNLEHIGKTAKDTKAPVDELAKAFEFLATSTAESKITKQIDSIEGAFDKINLAFHQGKVAVEDYETARVNSNQRIIDLDNAQKIEAEKLAAVLPNALAKYLPELKARSLEQVQIVTSTFSQMESGATDGVNSFASTVAARIKEVFAQMKDVGNIFKAIGGTEADAEQTLAQIDSVLQRARELYANHATNLKGEALVTQNDLERIESDSAEKRIAIDRKFGKDVADSQIAAANQIKVAWVTAHMDIEQAQKTLGVVSTQQYADQVAVATAAYGKIRDSAYSTQQDILKGQAALYADQLALQQANGDRVTDIQKAHLAKMQELALQGQKNWATQVDELAVDAGKAMSKGMDNIIESFLAGKLSLKKAWDEMLTELTTAFVKAFISPITKSIGDFIANTMSQLLGGNGFGGAIAAAKTLSQLLSGSGEVAKEVSGIGATVSALGGVSQVGNAVGSGEAVANAASGAASAAGGASSAAGGVASAASGIMGIANVVSGAVSAISSVVGNFQFAHMNTALGRIEQNTREISIVTWQNGADSLQGLAKESWLVLLQIRDRLVDIGTDLIVAVNASLEAINNTLRTDIYQAIMGAQGAAYHGGDAAANATEDAGRHVRDAIEGTTNAVNKAGADTSTATEAATAAINDANQSATAAAEAMSQGLSDVQATTADAGNTVAQTVADSGSTIAQTVADSGAVVAAAVSNGFSIAGLTSQQMLEQLNVIGANGGAFTNAYTDAKNAVISSKTYLDDLAAQIAANQKAQADAVAKALNAGKTAQELAGFSDPTGKFIPRSGDTSAPITGNQGFGAVTSPIADFNIPASLPLTSPGFAPSQPSYLVPPADPRTMAPGTASYVSSKGPYAPPAYTGGLEPRVIQLVNNGVITSDQYKDELARYIADQNARNP